LGISSFPDIEDRKDVGVIQRGGCARFLFEPLQAIPIGAEAGRQDFDGDVAPEPGVPCAIHLAHAARTEWADNLIGTEASAERKGHRSWG
jgi:hypothetical protein